jgi:hypothetical protein
MLVFLSCDKTNNFFLKAAEEAKGFIDEKIRPYIELFNPPNAGTASTGSVVGNVARILFSELILMDITPKVENDDKLVYNPGVMIEFGMVFSLELKNSSSVGSVEPILINKPNYHVFSRNNISRSKLTPIFNTTDIFPYSTDDDGKKELVDQMFKLMIDAVGKKLDSQPSAANIQNSFSYVYFEKRV